MFKDMVAICKKSKRKHKLIREAIEIQKYHNNFNKEDGYKFSDKWKAGFRAKGKLSLARNHRATAANHNAPCTGQGSSS